MKELSGNTLRTLVLPLHQDCKPHQRRDAGQQENKANDSMISQQYTPKFVRLNNLLVAAQSQCRKKERKECVRNDFFGRGPYKGYSETNATMNVKEKLGTVATTMASRAKSESDPAAIEKPTITVVSLSDVELLTNDWPEMAKKSAKQTIEKYGPPNEATPSHLVWFNNGVWKRTVVHRHEIPHDFPQPHTDVIENVISYKVPVEKLTELGRFDGSLISTGQEAKCQRDVTWRRQIFCL
jgi:hypothetical protein